MPTYVKAITTQNDELFLNCGTKEIAGNNTNLNMECAGPHFSLVSSAQLRLSQPFDASASSFNNARFTHGLTLIVPNYQPIQSMMLNAINEQKVIQELMLNTVAIRPNASRQTLIGQYIASNGILLDYICDPTGNGLGRISLSFVFEKVLHTNMITNTSGLAQTTSA